MVDRGSLASHGLDWLYVLPRMSHILDTDMLGSAYLKPLASYSNLFRKAFLRQGPAQTPARLSLSDTSLHTDVFLPVVHHHPSLLRNGHTEQHDEVHLLLAISAGRIS